MRVLVKGIHAVTSKGRAYYNGGRMSFTGSPPDSGHAEEDNHDNAYGIARSAAYVGVSPSKFDELVRDGRMPKPFSPCIWATSAPSVTSCFR